MLVKKDILLEYLKLKKQNLPLELGVLILKPDCLPEEITELKYFAINNDLEILFEKQIKFSYIEVIALYPESFCYSDNDLIFGINWKEETLKYMTSGPSICYLFKGENSISKLAKFKYLLREKYGKLTRPNFPLSPEEFNERVIRNFVHVADSDETQSALWILFS